MERAKPTGLFKVTRKGLVKLARQKVSVSGSVMSDYTYGILRSAQNGKLKKGDLGRRYGTEGSKIIGSCVKSKLLE